MIYTGRFDKQNEGKQKITEQNLVGTKEKEHTAGEDK
jgi:hypothetical protein